MSELLSWLDSVKIELKIKANYSKEDTSYNLLFIWWDYQNIRHLLEFNLSYYEIAHLLSHPKDLKAKLQFIEFKLKGTL